MSRQRTRGSSLSTLGCKWTNSGLFPRLTLYLVLGQAPCRVFAFSSFSSPLFPNSFHFLCTSVREATMARGKVKLAACHNLFINTQQMQFESALLKVAGGHRLTDSPLILAPHLVEGRMGSPVPQRASLGRQAGGWCSDLSEVFSEAACYQLCKFGQL